MPDPHRRSSGVLRWKLAREVDEAWAGTHPVTLLARDLKISESRPAEPDGRRSDRDRREARFDRRRASLTIRSASSSRATAPSPASTQSL
jgi:hypothetical protein